MHRKSLDLPQEALAEHCIEVRPNGTFANNMVEFANASEPT
jgi:hypothetical protein